MTSEPVGIDCGATCSADFDYDTDVTLTAVNGLESTFTGWSVDECPGIGSCTVTMSEAKSVTATFTLNKYTLTVGKDGTGTGTVTSDPAGIDCGSTCFADFDYDTDVTLTADPSPDSTFTGWSEAGCPGTGSCTVAMITAKSVMATFTRIPCSASRLIADIEAANADPDATTINLDANCSYNLTSIYAADPDGYGPVGLPPISTPITLVGNNSSITRNATEAFRLFYISTTGNLALEDVTLSNGLAQGGEGGLSTGAGGGGGAGLGGAIFNRGTLTLVDSIPTK